MENSNEKMDTMQQIYLKGCPIKCKYYDLDGVICNEDPAPCPVYQKYTENLAYEENISPLSENKVMIPA